MFAEEQRAEKSLESARLQARAGMHEMPVEGGLLFHRETLDGKACTKLVLLQEHRREVLTLAHDAPNRWALSEKRTKQHIHSTFFWPTLEGVLESNVSHAILSKSFQRQG